MKISVNFHETDPKVYDALPMPEEDGSSGAHWKSLEVADFELTFFRRRHEDGTERATISISL